MLYDFKYNGLIERQKKIAEAEGKGYRMLHDNFDNPNWKRGDKQIGTMIFTDEPQLIPEPVPIRNLETEFDNLERRVEALEINKA